MSSKEEGTQTDKNITCRFIIHLNGLPFLSKFLTLNATEYPTIKELCGKYLPEKYKINTKYYANYIINLLQDEFTLDEEFQTISIEGFTVKINYYSLAPVD